MSCVLPLVVALLAPPHDGWPPPPDFETKIDYVKWWREQVRGEYKPTENAGELYQSIFPGLDDANTKEAADLGFAGYRHDPEAPKNFALGPWDPTEHPVWEKSYERTQALLRTFRRAAERPYCLFPMRFTQQSENDPKTLFHLNLLHHDYFKACVRGLSEASWRAEKGRINSARLLDNCRTMLLAARQLEREPNLTSHLRSMSTRSIAYYDLRYALHHGVLSLRQRAAALRMLAAVDTGAPPFEQALWGDCAGVYDLLQYAADPNQPPFGGNIVGELVALIRIGMIDARQTARVWGSYHHRLAEHARLPFKPQQLEAMEELQEEFNETNLFTATLLPSLSIAYLQSAKLETQRRLTRVLLAIHVFHDKHAKWPTALPDLHGLVADQLATDPLGGQPFGYKLVGGKPLLYSAGLDCDDDGGKHDPRWGRRRDADPDGDYVFWPIQR